MRLIDVDALADALFEKHRNYPQWVAETIGSMPEAVVRCKDCRFSILIPPCNQRKCDGAMEKIVSDDFFCADGERKEGDGDGNHS